MSNILIIDDDPQFIEILSLAFRKKNIKYHIANTINEVKKYVDSFKYDLILHDIFFPSKEAGFNSLKSLSSSKANPNTPIILMTSMPTKFFFQEENIDKYLALTKILISKQDDVKDIVNKSIEIIENQ